MTKSERVKKLAHAKKMLTAWEEAELALTTGQEYSIAGRSVKSVTLKDIEDAQEKWKAEIKRLKTGRTGGARIAQIVPQG